MDRGGRSIGAVWLALLAFAGLLGGHLLSYAIVAPHGHERAELLRTTGHGLPDLFGPLAIAALLGAVVGFIGLHLRSGSPGPAERRGPRPVLTLWALQTLGFALLESTERALSAHPVAELLQEPAFLVGIAAQLLVALAGSLLITALRRTADAIRRLLTWVPPVETAVPAGARPATSAPRQTLHHYSWSLRGPPLS